MIEELLGRIVAGFEAFLAGEAGAILEALVEVFLVLVALFS